MAADRLMADTTAPVVERRADWLAILALCSLLFGWSFCGGRPLTMHEAILPQTAREMLEAGEVVVPTSGGRPWLERPPLPQWIVAAVAWAIGRCDAEWIVRLPSAFCALAIVMLTARMGNAMFGRPIGLMAALVLGTSFEFVSYAWLAEHDIYLGLLTTAALASFVSIEFGSGAAASAFESQTDPFNRSRFLGNRPRSLWWFFFLLGATNLAKGLLFGAALIVFQMAAFIALRRDVRLLRKYFWFWGWALAACVGLTWPVAASLRYPDVVDLWRYDLIGRLNGSYAAITEPWWYYGPAFLAAMVPWTPALLLGLPCCVQSALRHADWAKTDSVASATDRPKRGAGQAGSQFLVAGVIAPLLLLSLASGKHHHYLVPILPMSAIVGAIGLSALGDCLQRLGVLWLGRRPTVGLVAVGTTMAYLTVYTFQLPASDQCLEDTQFLKQAAAAASRNEKIVVNADIGSMDCFRILFYLRDAGRLVHNLDYLLDQRLQAKSALVLTRAKDAAKLEMLGEVETLAASLRSRRECSPDDRFTLFRVRFRSGLARRPMTDHLSPMQTMGRL